MGLSVFSGAALRRNRAFVGDVRAEDRLRVLSTLAGSWQQWRGALLASFVRINDGECARKPFAASIS